MIRNLIFRCFQKSFNQYKEKSLLKLQTEDPELLEEYQNFRDHIRECIAATKFWHGNGRYQYALTGSSKYEGIDTNECVDVFSAIVEERQLKTYFDPWAEKYVHAAISLSLANQWGYGRMYAYYHQD